MHFYGNLISYMLPIQLFMTSMNHLVPPGYARVITARGNFVITARDNFVIYKE